MDGLVLVAAGASRRFGGSTPKVLRLLGGSPVLVRALAPFLVAVEELAVVVAARREDRAAVRKLVPRAQVVLGGDTRAESVWNGVDALPAEADVILVHDAARPLVSVDLVRRVLSVARRDGAAAPVIGLSDTIHRIEGSTGEHPARFVETLDRSRLAAAQTPQAARAALLRRAFAEAGEARRTATDEVSLLLAAGIPVSAVQGDPRNRKITFAEDLALLERSLAEE